MIVTKYEALGNDFLLTCWQSEKDYSLLAKKLCAPKVGIGADGLIVVKKLNQGWQALFFNADGSSATMCGNGLRCVARYCMENGQRQKKFQVFTADGVKSVSVQSLFPFEVKILLGERKFFAGQRECEKAVLSKVETVGKKIFLFKTFLGVPHAVLVEEEDLIPFAKEISLNKNFCDGSNVDFVRVKDEKNIFVKTFERGVGWTRACGTGAGASVAVCFDRGATEREVFVESAGGVLKILVAKKNVFAIGGANKVFSAEI